MSGELIRIADTSDIAEGEARVFNVEDISIVICNVNGIFHAIENVCSHDEAPLGEGELFGNEIECPRHGARFDVATGEVTRIPAVAPIETFPVHIKDDTIYIEYEE